MNNTQNENNPEQNLTFPAGKGSNPEDPKKDLGIKDDDKLFQQSREGEYEQLLPGKYSELQQNLENDHYLSDEEITAVLDESELDKEQAGADRTEQQHLEEQQAQLSELEKSTGYQLNTDSINFMVPNQTLTDLSVETPDNINPDLTPIHTDELSKVDLQPSYLFAKDENGEVKVVSQNQETNAYELNKPEDKSSFVDNLPKIFLTKNILENFIENFNRAHTLTGGTIKATGEKLSDLIRGKVDLILVNSTQGYDQSLNMAKDFFSQNNNLNQSKTVNQNQPTKYEENQVNWNSLEKIGISKERLQATGQLTKFLNGEKTGLIEPSSLKEGNKYPFDNTPFKLYLEPGPKGPENKLIFKEPKLKVQDDYEGQKLSVEDKLNLITKGHLGRLMDINGKPHFVSVDRDLNAIGHREAETLKIPAKIKLANGSEIQLNKEQQQLLTEGKPIPIAGLKDNKGQSYSGQLIVNASSGKLDIMREIPTSMTQAVAQNEDKKQVQANNEGIGKQRGPENDKPKLGL